MPIFCRLPVRWEEWPLLSTDQEESGEGRWINQVSSDLIIPLNKDLAGLKTKKKINGMRSSENKSVDRGKREASVKFLSPTPYHTKGEKINSK